MKSKLPDLLRLDRVATPLGEALIVTDMAGYLHALDWAEHQSSLALHLRRYYGSATVDPGAAPAHLKRALGDYFEGDLGCLGAIAWRAAGTPFQRAVWNELRMIPPGRTLGYGALAAKLGCPNSARAVGLANGANPISVVVPCHRVIGADGSLTGYGGGIERKRWLLNHEGATFRDTPAPPADASQSPTTGNR